MKKLVDKEQAWFSTKRWQEGEREAEDIAWIEEAAKALEQEPIKLEFLEEVLVA